MGGRRNNFNKIFLCVLVIVMFAVMTSCSGDSKNSAIGDINKALEKSLELKSGSIETNITAGSYYPKEAPMTVTLDFESEEKSKDKDKRNIEFEAFFTYKDSTDEVKNLTNYEGMYLNTYYPYPRYNTVRSESVESITADETDDGTAYYVYYSDSHMSRREEWAFCKVTKDYEYFLIDDDGVITEYSSHTYFQEEDKKTSKWIDGESRLSVKLKEYTLF